MKTVKCDCVMIGIISAEPIQNDEAMTADGENQAEEDKEMKEQETHEPQHEPEQEQEQEHEETPNEEPIQNHVQESKEEEEVEVAIEAASHLQETEDHDMAHNDVTPNVIENNDEPPKNSDQVSFNR